MIIEKLTNDLLVLREVGSEYPIPFERPKEKHFLYGIWEGKTEKGELEFRIDDDAVLKVDWNIVYDGPYILKDSSLILGDIIFNYKFAEEHSVLELSDDNGELVYLRRAK